MEILLLTAMWKQMTLPNFPFALFVNFLVVLSNVLLNFLFLFETEQSCRIIDQWFILYC